MAGVLQHLRSSTLDKRPNPASMVDGQVAINYASGSPGMFFKDSNGNLVKVGPVHVGTTAPNVSPASGGTAGNSKGEQWLDTTGDTYVFKVWDGGAWRSESGTFVDVNGDVMTGALGIIAGSAGSPGLYFSGDTNTGLYSPGADQLAISTNGTGRLFVDSSGNIKVSIGEISQTSATSYIRIDGGDGAGAGANILAFGQSHGSAAGRLVLTAVGSESMQFGAGGAERMRLTSTGALGLGTSSPDANSQLHIVGSSYQPLYVNTTTAGGGGTVFLQSGTQALYTGTAGSSWLSGSAATDGLVRAEANLILATNGNTRAVTIDSSQRVGIGTTSVSTKLHIVSNGAGGDVWVANGSGQNCLLEMAGNGNTPQTSSALYGQDSSNNVYGGWARGAHPVLFGTNGTERGRWDSSGRFLVGTSSSSAEAKFIVQGGTTAAGGAINIQRNATTASAGSTIGYISFANSANDAGAFISANGDGTWTAGTSHPTCLVFSTTADGASSPTERARITQRGAFKATNTGSYINSTAAFHEFVNNADDIVSVYIRSTAASGQQYGLYIETANDQNDGTRFFLQCVGATTERATIRSNGGIANYSANNVNLSDRNVKKDIAPAAGTWDCLKEWEIVNFRYKDQSDEADLSMGVIAQQVAESCPEVITVFQEAKEATEDQPAQEERIGVKEQQMMWMAIKALQEAQLRIETLESEMAAVKAQLS